MQRVHVGVQQANGHGLHTVRLQRLDRRRDRGGIQRFVLTAGGEEPSAHFPGERARHERAMAVEKQVVGLGPVAATDGIDVARAARDDEAGLRTLALDQRVDGGGRAVDQLGDAGGSKPALVEAVDDALHQVFRRGQTLRLRKAASLGVVADEIREGPADVDCDDDQFYIPPSWRRREAVLFFNVPDCALLINGRAGCDRRRPMARLKSRRELQRRASPRPIRPNAAPPGRSPSDLRWQADGREA